MALTSTDRYRILANIVAQKGTDNVDLHAELAKMESMVNVMDTQNTMQPPMVSQPVIPTQPSTAPELPLQQ